MCSLTLALTGLTTGLSMVGQYQQSRAQAAAYEAQAQAAQIQAEAQAEAARQQAEATRLQAKYEAQQAEAEYQNARIQNRKGEQTAEQFAEQQRQLDARRRLTIAQQNYSEKTAALIDEETLNIVNTAYRKAKEILRDFEAWLPKFQAVISDEYLAYLKGA